MAIVIKVVEASRASGIAISIEEEKAILTIEAFINRLCVTFIAVRSWAGRTGSALFALAIRATISAGGSNHIEVIDTGETCFGIFAGLTGLLALLTDIFFGKEAIRASSNTVTFQ